MLAWTFNNESRCNEELAFLTDDDIWNNTLSSTKICETTTADYRLTAVVAQDKGQKSNCYEPHYISILLVQPLTSNKAPFSVSCSIDDDDSYTLTTHLEFTPDTLKINTIIM